LTPLFGALTDHIGRRPVMIGATIAYFLLPYPLLHWVQEAPSVDRFLVMQLVVCSAVAAHFGTISTALAEQFPTAVRSTGMAIAYNFAVMLFGGFAPFIVTWLIKETDTPLAPAFYAMFGAAVGLAGALTMAEGRPRAALVLAPSGGESA
jgi:MFS transporter, MHS family, proline/betaine transporter